MNYENLTIKELNELLEEFKVAKRYIEDVKKSKLPTSAK